jgi:hypothetical protein
VRSSRRATSVRYAFTSRSDRWHSHAHSNGSWGQGGGWEGVRSTRVPTAQC